MLRFVAVRGVSDPDFYLEFTGLGGPDPDSEVGYASRNPKMKIQSQILNDKGTRTNFHAWKTFSWSWNEKIEFLIQ
jgi:hypothetical protein